MFSILLTIFLALVVAGVLWWAGDELAKSVAVPRILIVIWRIVIVLVLVYFIARKFGVSL